jgi:signal transduction histidine kinase
VLMRISFGMKLVTLVTVLLLSLSVSSFCQQPVLLTDTAMAYRLDASTQIFIDSTSQLSFEEITAPSFQTRFWQRPDRSLKFGYLKPVIWLKVKTKTASLRTQWYLEIPAPFLEYVDFYQLRQADSTWHHSESGYYRKHGMREVSHTGHVIPLGFNSDSTNTLYIKIAGLSPKTFPLYAIEKTKFHEQVRLEDLWYGIFFGILIVMFFYNFFIFLSLRQSNYLLYICTIVCTFLIFTAASGYGGKFLWPGHPLLNYYAGRMTLGVMAVFLAVFTIRFLEVKKYSRVMYFLLLSLIPLAVVATFLVAAKNLPSAGNNLISVATIMLMATGIVCSVKGNKTGYFFIAAWTLYLAGGLFLTLRNSGVFEFNFWTTHFVEIGAALETIIIGFALGDRYRRFKNEKEEAQRLALSLQHEAREKLEVKVKERTLDLSKANEELQSTLETIKLQAQIIESKNAELDAFFYRISHDLKGPIASLLGVCYVAKMEISDVHALDYFEKQRTQAERLNNMVTGLANLTRLNYAELVMEKIDFTKMIDECINSYNAHPNFSGITFTKDIQHGIEFYTEWTLLNAILQNLIENAIKYSQRRAPFVNIRVREDGPGVIIEIEDNGVGIPREHQHKIFEMFYRATQNTNGSGLGLYILKRSIDRLKGTIEMSSDVGVGTTFTVRLPSLVTGHPI